MILFFGGMAGVGIELAYSLQGGQVNESLLLLFAAMMGLPAFLRSDEKSSGRQKEDDGDKHS